MSLLAPWFLAGLLLIGGPIVAHLIRRATRERIAFSTLRFLDPSAPRLDRRSRVQNPWLLALRCIVVAVLALGFARPFLRQSTPPVSVRSTPRHVVAVLDESASMRRTGLWDAAREQVATLAASLGAGDRFLLLGAGTSVVELITAERWMSTAPGDRAALVRSVLDARQPGWGPTPFDSAAEAALARWDDLAESGDLAPRRELAIVSDFAAGGRLTGLANLAWPANARVNLLPVTSTLPGNASVQWLGWSEQDPQKPAARVRFSRSFDVQESLSWQWRDARTGAPLSEPEPLGLLPGGSEIRLIPVPANAPAALRLDVTGDQQEFDNTLWLVRSPTPSLDISLLGTGAANDPQHAGFYIERAVAGWRQPTAHLRTTLPENQSARSLIVVTSALDSARISEVRERLQAGSFALVLLGNEGDISTAAAIAGESGWSAAATRSTDALFGQLDFQHPLFNAFADPLYSDFTRIRFWQPQPVALPSETTVTTVARFDDGSPAVMEVPVGRGLLVVWAGGWTPAASQWVLSSKFVPWLQGLAERAAGGTARPAIAEIGDPARLIASGSAATWRSLAPNASTEASSEPPDAPGIYEVTQGGETREVALLVPAAESQTQVLPLDTWEQLGVPLREDRARASLAEKSHVETGASAAIENRQQMWRWLLWLAAALLALESLASFAVSRRAEPATNS